jgi:UDP-N-acetylglucosamine 2-epimerase
MEKSHSGIAIIIGTKAELIKCMPIMLELQKQNKGYWFIHTGQHNLGNSCEEFGIKKPDFVLSKEPDRKIGTKFWSKIKISTFLWCVLTLFKIKKIIRKLQPKYVIYHGDTMNTAIAAAASSKVLNLRKRWKNVHLEAGLKSGSIREPFPEEFTRQVIDRFTDLLLAVSDGTVANLKKRKFNFVRSKIKKIGNTIIDSSIVSYNLAKKKNYKIPEGEYVLINLHRHENIVNKKRLQAILEILKETKIKGIWPLHENTKYFLKKYGLFDKAKEIENIEITPLVNYSEFISLLANCKYLITDGGSIQEESLVFKKPCVLLRKKTERQEGLFTGINFLTKLNINYSKEIIKKIEGGELKIRKFKNPYGEEGVSKKVLEVLR